MSINIKSVIAIPLLGIGLILLARDLLTLLIYNKTARAEVILHATKDNKDTKHIYEFSMPVKGDKHNHNIAPVRGIERNFRSKFTVIPMGSRKRDKIRYKKNGDYHLRSVTDLDYVVSSKQLAISIILNMVYIIAGMSLM